MHPVFDTQHGVDLEQSPVEARRARVDDVALSRLQLAAVREALLGHDRLAAGLPQASDQPRAKHPVGPTKLGNPGVGAAAFMHVCIPYFIQKYADKTYTPVIIAANTEKLPPEIESFQADTVTQAASKAKEIGCDYFVFRPRQNEEDNILDHIDKIKMPSIGDSQLTPLTPHMRKMVKSKYFKSLVCIGREQYDFLMDTPLKPKLSYIDNGVHVESCWLDCDTKDITKDPNLVVYMGALVPVKSFHVLAEAWPKVLKRCPEAKLSVIGSVKMYGDNLSVGPLGVADENYERQHIIPHLCDKEGNLHPSVTFHGQMGREKYDLLRRASIGIANPTGRTETCCVSAVEMSACKTAIVSGAYYALLDTVLHKETGLLGRGIDQLVDNICQCIENPDLAKTLGENGFERAMQQYDFEPVTHRWVELFEALKHNKQPRPIGRLKNIFYHFKCLRIANTILQSTIGRLIYWPSVYEAQTLVYKVLKSLKLKS